ncbi:MAG: hypothetical protein AB1716_26940, partial [Planctomycetota bacterium]
MVELVVALGVCAWAYAAQQEAPAAGGFDRDQYQAVKARAEAKWAEGSYQQAHALYTQIAAAYGQAGQPELPAAEARWVRFRLADTLWRSQAATQSPDDTKRQKARAELEELIRAVQRVEDRDRVWAEAEESLADLYWRGQQYGNWHQAWPYYAAALEWWAQSAEVDTARGRYLKIIRKAAQPNWGEREYWGWYGHYGQNIPLDILEDAARVAVQPDDAAHAHYLIAMALQHSGEYRQQMRVPGEFEAALRGGKEMEWYDDALYHYAEWLMQRGVVTATKEGGHR